MSRPMLLLLTAILLLSCGAQSLARTEPPGTLDRINNFPLGRLPLPVPVTVNDPLFHSQSYLRQTHISEAWQVTRGSPRVKIAIIDGTIAPVPDLEHVPISRLGGVSPVTSHATPIAALIAAPMNDGVGVAGVTHCTLLEYAIPSDDEGFPAVRIYWAMRHASQTADIINCSFGSEADVWVEQALVSNSRAVIVASAMNRSTYAPYYPAAYPEVIAVGSCDAKGSMSLFSNFGKWVTLFAPGENLLTALETGAPGRVSGTSFAAPLVSGTVGLMLTTNPRLTPVDVKAILLHTADVTNGGKRLNAYRAVKMAEMLRSGT